jgi:hypothetical protein
LANSFTGIDLDDYGVPTQRGYSALFRVLLVWSAFERYMPLVGLNRRRCEELLDKHGARTEAREIIDSASRGYFRFIYHHSRPFIKEKLEKCFQNDSDNVVWLAVAVRHRFAHGDLTPNADGVSPENVVADCDRLSDLLLRVMDRDFTSHVNEFFETLGSAYDSDRYGPP